MSAHRALRCEDWRAADPAALAPLYGSECRRWRETIAWDFAPSCAIIEAARRAGQLPGVLARRPGGAIAGWTFFVVHDSLLQIGGLVGDGESSRRALLRAVVSSAEPAGVRGVSCFLYPQSPALRRTLEQERFTVEPHLYLARDLSPDDEARGTTGSWPADLAMGPFADREGDLVRLVARAYEGSREATCFAPDLRLDQWAHYVGRLIQTEACGRYLPAASLALRDADGQSAAALLMTRIGEATAHLAQVVVDPRWRGRALARDLVLESCRRLALLGYRQVTLLVAESNQPARRVYQQLGFRNQQVFLHGTRQAASGG